MYEALTVDGAQRRRSTRPVGAAAALCVLATGAVALPADAATQGPGPSWTSDSAAVHYSSQAVLKTPGGTLVLTADTKGYLTARNGSGAVVWRKWIDPAPGGLTCSNSAPAVGDITGDGVPEIVVGAGCHDPKFARQQGGVVAYDANGTTIWRFRTGDAYNVWTGGAPDGYSDGVTGAPAIGDLDGDGVNEVVFGSFDHNSYVLDGSGRQLGRYDNWDTIFSTPALVDIDADPGLEIIIGGDATENRAIPHGSGYWTGGGTVRALDLTHGGLQQKWLRKVEDIVAGAIAVSDVNGDGRLDAVFTAGGFYNTKADSRRLFAVDAKSGSDLPGFPKDLGGTAKTSVAVGQLVPGGPQEIVVGDFSGAVFAFNGNGNQLWRTQTRSNPNFGVEGGGVLIADVVGDGAQEVVVPMGVGGLTLISKDGAVLNDWVGGSSAIQNAPVVVDFGSQGGRQIVSAGHNGDLSTGLVNGVRIKDAVVADEWPTFGRTAQRTGSPSPTRTGENVNLSKALYADMLSRGATPDEARHWARVMTMAGDRSIGTGPGFRDSLEYRRLRVHLTYQQVLGRPEESPAALDYWAAKIGRGELTIDQLPGIFMVTDEFYKLGGGTDSGLVSMMVRRSMERPATQADLDKWVPVVRNQGQLAGSLGIYNDPESVLIRVNRTYEAWLQRPARSDERQWWSQYTRSHGDDAMRYAVMNGQEYVNNAQGRSYPSR